MQNRKDRNKNPLPNEYYFQKEYQLDSEETRVQNDSSLTQQCFSCESNSVFYDASVGEAVCSDCGTVMLERSEAIGRGSQLTKGVNKPTSLAFPDKGLSTVITNANTDASGTSLHQDQLTSVNRIRKFDKISVNNRAEIRNLRNALVIMATIKDKLALTDSLMEGSAYYYRKALEKKMIKGRSIREVVVASIYGSCKEMNVPRTLQEIAQAANADYIFAGKCYRIMAQKLEISPSIVDASNYISKIADNANVNQKTYKRAAEMLDVVKKDSLSYGKDPKALATAVLYHACIAGNLGKTSQLKIAEAGGISVVTLRKRVSDVQRVLRR